MGGEGHGEKVGAFVRDKEIRLLGQLRVAPVVVIHVTDGHAHHLHTVEVVDMHVEALVAGLLGYKNEPFSGDPNRSRLGVVGEIADRGFGRRISGQ